MGIRDMGYLHMTAQDERGAAPGYISVKENRDDEVRIMRASRDDLTCFAPLYSRYFPQVYAYCLHRVGDRQEAEDLTSLIFARALAGVQGYRDGSVAAWLFRIAHNALANHYRDRRAHISIEDTDFDVPAEGVKPIERVVQAEEHEAIRELVAALPPDQQDLLALKMSAGLKAEEIGALLGKSQGAIRVELHRIIKGLRARYHELYEE